MAKFMVKKVLPEAGLAEITIVTTPRPYFFVQNSKFARSTRKASLILLVL